MTTQPPREILVFKNNGFGILRTVKREDSKFRLAFAVKEAVRLYAKRGSPHCMWPAPWDVATLIEKSALPRVYCLIGKGKFSTPVRGSTTQFTGVSSGLSGSGCVTGVVDARDGCFPARCRRTPSGAHCERGTTCAHGECGGATHRRSPAKTTACRGVPEGGRSC